MRNGQTRRTKTEELRQRAEKVVSLPQADFKKAPATDVQRLIKDLCLETSELETRVEHLQQAEAELGEARKQTTELFNFAPVGYFVIDSRGMISNANFTASHMLGIPREKMLNTPFINFIEMQHHDAFRAYLDEIARTGALSSAEIEMRKSDGSKFYAQLQSVVLYEKSITSYRISVADITDRKRVEQALSESEQKYRDLAELFPEPVFESDVHGKVTYANQNALASFQLNAEDMRKGINILDLIAPQEKTSAAQHFALVLEHGDVGAHEHTLTRRDGSTFPALVHTNRIMLDDKVVGVRGTLLDISERKKAEQVLAESEKRFRTALDNMLEACVILDFNWRYLYANDSAVRMGRRTREERLGHTLMEVYPGIEKQDAYAHIQRCLGERVTDSYETEFTFPEGIKVWLDMRLTPVPEGILIVYYDITERKLAEQRTQKGIERVERIYGIASMTEMQPIGLLMIEHRLMERVFPFFAREKLRMQESNTLARDLIEYLVDFFRTYADKTHHGKEENILFKALAARPLTPEHRQIMDELLQEHELARKLVAELVSAKKRWESGDAAALKQVIAAVDELLSLYPKHIEKEDKRFFLPSMSYFSAEEQDNMLLECWEFDRQLIHQKYAEEVEALKAQIDQQP